MNFEKMSISDILHYNIGLVIILTMLGVLILLAGFVIRKSTDKTWGNFIIGLGVLVIIVLNTVVVIAGNQSKELMNGESTTNVQSVYYINGDKIVKLNVDGHPIRLKYDEELKKDDRVRLKAKNVEVRNNNTIKYDNHNRQLFKYEKVNE